MRESLGCLKALNKGFWEKQGNKEDSGIKEKTKVAAPLKPPTPFRYYIRADKCPGCLLCVKACQGRAISGEFKKPHVIDQEKCTRCGTCFDVCKIKAVMRLPVD